MDGTRHDETVPDLISVSTALRYAAGIVFLRSLFGIYSQGSLYFIQEDRILLLFDLFYV